MVKIAYGVHGYSRGHAARALAVLPELTERYEVKVFAGGDAYASLANRFDVERIPTMRYVYHRGRRSTLRTLARNLPLFWELVLHGPSVRALRRSIERYAPDVVISDAEAWTHAVARTLGIPRIGFDHFGMMVHCNLDLSLSDWFRSLVDRGVYGLLTGRPERVLISSFYPLSTRSDSIEVIPPLLRDEVHSLKPSAGQHLLVYLNQGNVQLTPRVLRALGKLKRPVILYGTARTGVHGRICYRPASNEGFLRDLASCRAVVSTAGNQLVGEALSFGKPLLVMPESTVEQRRNARAIVELGIGEVVGFGALDAGTVERFLGRVDEYAERARRLSTDGRGLALARLHQWVRELARSTPASLLRPDLARAQVKGGVL